MATKASEAMKVDTALVRELAKLLDETQLTEIEVEDNGRKIRVARQGTPVVASAPAPASVAAQVTAPAPAAPTGAHPGTVKSPMVGTVYLASSPEAADFVSVGAAVKEGDTLVIIEAMKVMNPITAPRAGKVTQVIVANGQPVEFDQALVVIE
jgi:acetyl-CoA carboxylase biotin carboxyl carrier protein